MSVFVTNLDDFIGPSQACVNPFVTAKINPQQASAGMGGGSGGGGEGKITIQADFSSYEFMPVVQPDLIRVKASSSSATTTKVATVSLNDCLACR